MGKILRAASGVASHYMNERGERLTSTIVIPTHNRCNDLELTCERISTLDPGPDSVIVVLDGCTDGSREMLLHRFSSFRVLENPVCLGSIPSRDRAFEMVTSDLIVSLDDDSYPLDADFLAKVSDLFRVHPEAAVMTFPALFPDGRHQSADMGPNSKARYVPTYPGCSAVLRRDLYGSVARYAAILFHNYEEPDFSLQCYGAGYGVWFEPTLC